MKAVIIKENELPKEIEVRDELEEYYRLLDCSMIEMPMRKIGDKYYVIICDEEGLFADKAPMVVTYDDDDSIIETIVGSVIIVNNGSEGDVVALTDEDVKNILDPNKYATRFFRNRDGKVSMSRMLQASI